MSRDPLPGIESQTPEIREALLIQAVRATNDRISEVDADVISMKRALYGLIFTILAGLIIFVVTFNFTGHT